MAGAPTATWGDHEVPLNDTEFPPADTATQNVDVGHETEVSVPPDPVAGDFDQVPSRQRSADPFSSTATHRVRDGHETP